MNLINKDFIDWIIDQLVHYDYGYSYALKLKTK